MGVYTHHLICSGSLKAKKPALSPKCTTTTPTKKATTNSSYRHIQRFFKEVVFDYDAIARLIMGLVK
ncbi:hypothetical protein, partial [Avibacterium avium]|uniref:hypothetical protein n=1 Tax=Avibacterium avium TaxID=751 RepID=UPI0039FCF675